MFVLNTQYDYDAIRYTLGLENDQGRLLTDGVIEAYPNLPMAELEAIRRYQVPNQAYDAYSLLMSKDPMDMNLNAFKAGICLLACANMTERLELTIPTRGELTAIGSIERNAINWWTKRAHFLSLANGAFSLIDETIAPHRFP